MGQAIVIKAGGKDFDRDMLIGQTHKTLLDFAWMELGRGVRNPLDILDYMSKNFTYVPNYNSVQNMETFFKHKYGDCSEFSLLSGYLLQNRGFEVFILISVPSHFGGHVSVIYKDGPDYYLMDTSRAALDSALSRGTGRVGILRLRDRLCALDAGTSGGRFGVGTRDREAQQPKNEQETDPHAAQPL